MSKQHIRCLFAAFSALVLASAARASDISALMQTEPLGQARMRVLLWDVYDATLYTQASEPFSFEKPFALQLDYLMAFSAEEIAQRSVEEMRAIGFTDEVTLAAWFSQMRSIFPDVVEGSEITGLYKPGAPTEFYQQGKQLGVVQDPEFGRWFFGIWLDSKSSDPSFRRKLVRAEQ